VGSREYGKSMTGLQQKPDDRWCVPLCAAEHRIGPNSQHAGSESDYWGRVGINPFAVAKALYARFVAEHPEVAARPAPRKKPQTIKRKPQGQRTKIKGRSAFPPKGSQKLRGGSRWPKRSM